MILKFIYSGRAKLLLLNFRWMYVHMLDHFLTQVLKKNNYTHFLRMLSCHIISILFLFFFVLGFFFLQFFFSNHIVPKEIFICMLPPSPQRNYHFSQFFKTQFPDWLVNNMQYGLFYFFILLIVSQMVVKNYCYFVSLFILSDFELVLVNFIWDFSFCI